MFYYAFWNAVILTAACAVEESRMCCPDRRLCSLASEHRSTLKYTGKTFIPGSVAGIVPRTPLISCQPPPHNPPGFSPYQVTQPHSIASPMGSVGAMLGTAAFIQVPCIACRAELMLLWGKPCLTTKKLLSELLGCYKGLSSCSQLCYTVAWLMPIVY